jgi:hypothetical protein
MGIGWVIAAAWSATVAAVITVIGHRMAKAAAGRQTRSFASAHAISIPRQPSRRLYGA